MRLPIWFGSRDSRTAKLTYSFNRRLRTVHKKIFLDHPLVTFLSAAVLYVGLILVFGRTLEIASNYLVTIPVMAAALTGGLRGGFLAGALGLSSNLFLFWVLGHPEFAPANPLVAEIFGIVIGSSLGYLSDYFHGLEKENQTRLEVEEDLRRTLKEKEWLLGEMQHRVKNNLAVIKSLIQLQAGRSASPEFKAAAETLTQRVLLISQIHERLYPQGELACIVPEEYIHGLCTDIVQAAALQNVNLDIQIDGQGHCLEINKATHLGYILNEVLINAVKYAFSQAQSPRITIIFRALEDSWRLEVHDNGKGFEPPAFSHSLGLKLIDIFSRSLGGTAQHYTDQGTVFVLEFPREADEELPSDSRNLDTVKLKG